MNRIIEAQYRRPTGVVGRYIGRKMIAQHAPVNEWTVDVLKVKPDDHILEIGFGAGSFHKVFSIHSIYFWPEPLRVLNEIMRVLKPGGMLIVTLLPKASPTDTGNSKFRPYSDAELSALLHVGGFIDMSIHDGRTITQKSNYSVVGYKPAN